MTARIGKYLATALALLAGIAGCSSSDSGTGPSPSSSAVSAIAITSASANSATNGSVVLLPGDSLHLIGTPVDSAGHPVGGKTVRWAAADTSIASVTPLGLMRAVTTGTTSVTATVDSVSTTISVTVAPQPVATVAIALATSNLKIGQTTQATVTLRDSHGATLAGRAISFTSGDPSLATVGTDGLVTAMTAGTVSITATSEGKSASAQLQVAAPVPGVPTQLASQSWAVVSGAATTTLPSSPTVLVRDGLGNPVVGANVTFAITVGGGSLIPSGAASATSVVVATGASGTATAPQWKLGSNPGLNSLSASVSGVTPITFSVTATAYHPLSVQLVVPAAGSYTAGPSAVKVCVTGSFITTGYMGGGVKSVVATYANGLQASLAWATPIGDVCADHGWTAALPLTGVQAGATVPILVTAVDTAGDTASVSTSVIYKTGPAEIKIWSSPSASAPVGSVVPLAVQVVDANGRGLANVAVTFTVTGGGFVGSAMVISGTDGITAPNWTIGPTAGPNTVTATASGTGLLTFTVQGTSP